jgi:hypothetical protein
MFEIFSGSSCKQHDAITTDVYLFPAFYYIGPSDPFLTDSQITGVAGCIALLRGLAITRGSEIFQNIPGQINNR